MRARSLVVSLLAGLALLFSAGALPASADPGNGNGNNANANGNNGNAGQAGNPPGANGTVKIHEYPDHKNASENANDPKVCRFEVHGNNFDPAQTGRWWVQEHQWGNGDSTKAAAPIGIRTYTANGQGDWTDNNGGAGHTLADGHYKLYVEMTHTAGNSGKTVTTYKHKVFKIDCPDRAPGGSTTGGSTTGGSTTGGTTTGGSTTGGTTSDTQTSGDVTVRSETTTVVEGGQQVRVIRIFRNDVLVNEVRTPLGVVAGSESGPTGHVIVIVEGMQPSAPSAAAEAAPQGGVLGQQSAPVISQLPSTSTAQDAGGILAMGLAAIAAGIAMLRRRSVTG